MQERDRILHHLQQMAEAIVALFGKNCEVCIHNLNDLHKSLVHISGSVTGRSIGAPATDLLIKALKKPADRIEDIHNYRTTSGDGRTLKSTTIFVRDTNDIPIYACCINLDTTDFFNASKVLSSFLEVEENGLGQGLPETFSHSTGDTIEALFEQAVVEAGTSRKNIVKTTIFLTDLGNFQEVNTAYGSFFNEAPPARATVQVAALPLAANIEIEAIATMG